MRRRNNVLQERATFTYAHASTSASLAAKIFPALRAFVVDEVRYVNDTGLAADATNAFTVQLMRCGAADALVFADATFTTTNATETVNITAHGLQTGDGPFRMSNSGGALPAGYAAATDYYAIRTGTGTLQLAATRALAYAGTAIAISGDGTGTHTLFDTADTRRPSVVASGVDTDSDTGATLVADAWVSLTVSDTYKSLVTGDHLFFLATKFGTQTLPAGRLVVDGRYM